MIVDILLLILGLALILGGANFLTDGASAIAKRWGVSELVIGLTVVAFGTSAPELAISVLSAAQHNAGLAIGNIVGSNIFNVLAIVGIVAMIRPIAVGRGLMANDIPLMILASVALVVCANAPLLESDLARVPALTRVDGIMFLLFFCIFMRYTFSIAKESAPGGESAPDATRTMPMWKSIVWVVGGLAALIGGGEVFVESASGIASALGVSESVIGLTIVAIGTSLPELATSVAAAVKDRPGLAVGNVVGSCVFNIFMVLGVSATVYPLPLGGITNFDLLTMLGAAILFWIFGQFIKQRTITRAEGAVMTTAYIAYMVILVANS